MSQSAAMEKAAVAAAAVGRWATQKDNHARFASLPAKHFDIHVVDDLESIALAAWHTAVELKSASAGKSEAKLPVALVNEAVALRDRMLALAVYHFGDDPKEKAEIDDIKLRTGYEDLASDLQRLAKLYRRHLDYVKSDTKNYRAGDETQAGKLAQSILKELGEAKNQDQKYWADLSLRAWTLLVKTYGEVAAAGAWLWRGEDPDAKFPSLYTVGRNYSRPARSKDAPEPEAPAEPEKKSDK